MEIEDEAADLAFRVFYTESQEGVGEFFKRMVESVADVSDAETRAQADLVVFKTFLVFEGNEGAVTFVEIRD